MIVTSLIENTSAKGLAVEHGLSLHIQLNEGKSVLFDMGQSALFAKNALQLGVNISDVDIAVVSHGHYDHGGGLGTFLCLNNHAPVYIHEKAFEPHFSHRDTGMRYIGLAPELAHDSRFVFCKDRMQISPQMLLFANVCGDCCRPVGNRLLFGPSTTVNDNFHHEQNLIIQEGKNIVLLAGCAHNGIVNILRRATECIGQPPTHVLAGMHLVKSGLGEAEEDIFIGHLSQELMKYSSTSFYTMHCTGEEAYEKLRLIMDTQIEYLSCGDRISI